MARHDSSQSTAPCESKTPELGLFQIYWAQRYQKDGCPVPASPGLAVPSNRTGNHLKSQCVRTKKSFFLKRLSRLCPGHPEQGREVWLTKRNMNGNQPADRIYSSLEAGKCTLFLKNQQSTVASLGQSTGSRVGQFFTL